MPETLKEDCPPQLERMRQRLAKVEQQACERSFFYAQAGHDLRQPLQALKIFVSLLKDEKLNHVQSELVDKIDKSTADLSFWVDNLLETAKLGSGGVVRRDQEFDLSSILKKLASEYQTLMSYRQGVLIYRGESIRVKSDPLLLERIIRNLLNNALKYSRGQIKMYCYRLPKVVKVIIKDNGYGLRNEENQHLFEAFYQCMRHKGRGSGLGLSIVKELSEILDIKVDIKSKWRKGTLAIVSIPVK